MKNLLGSLALLFIIVCVGLYAAGWLSWTKTDSTTTIELQTEKIEKAAGNAVDDGRRLLKETIDPGEDPIERPVHDLEPEAPMAPVTADDLDAPTT